MRYKLPPVDKTKLNQSYAIEREADELEKLVRQKRGIARRLRREHYNENYDRCRACDGHGTIGEGLTSHQCPYCNCGLLPKGTLEALRRERDR